MALVSIGILVILCIFIELKSDSKIWGNGIKGRCSFLSKYTSLHCVEWRD